MTIVKLSDKKFIVIDNIATINVEKNVCSVVYSDGQSERIYNDEAKALCEFLEIESQDYTHNDER